MEYALWGIRHYFLRSDSGVVNIYEDLINTRENRPKPNKVYMNLTTAITDITFSPQSQLMAISSYNLKDQLRLIHVPTYTVFTNWPTAKTPLGFVECVEFSPNSEYMVIGNAKGQILLYRLN